MSNCDKSSAPKACCFCGLTDDNEIEFGKIYQHNGIVTHYYCLLLSSNMEQKGNDNEGILGFLTLDIQKEVRRGKRLVCSYCKKSGATLGCCNVKCKKVFHYPCGLRAGSLHQFFGQFRSYCVNHRPKQEIDGRVMKELNDAANMLCYICYDKVNPRNVIDTLWAPCCKKNTWFHRKCVQQLAMSAGYFFKCPLCNNKNQFQQAMLEHGIFIPSQDASWELVPNAFQELLYRYDQCDAPICLCPKGRKHKSNNAKWELTLCRTCGSQGIHIACGELRWGNPIWECTDCSCILSKSKGTTSSSNPQTILRNNLDSEDSDSDISVGTEFTPVTCPQNNPESSSQSVEPEIKLRPGPRSFKVRQLIATNASKNAHSKTANVKQTTATLDSILETCLAGSNCLSVTNEKTGAPEKNAITLNIDDDVDIVQEGDNKLLENAFPTSNAKEIKINSLHEPTNNCSKIGDRASTTVNGNSFTITDLLQSNSFASCNDSLINHLSTTETKFFEEFNDENQNSRHANDNFFSNIKIVNVMSLSPDVFDGVPSASIEPMVISDSSNSAYNLESEVNCKRKHENVHLVDKTVSIPTVGSNQFKKAKGEQGSTEGPPINFVDVNTFGHEQLTLSKINIADCGKSDGASEKHLSPRSNNINPCNTPKTKNRSTCARPGAEQCQFVDKFSENLIVGLSKRATNIKEETNRRSEHHNKPVASGITTGYRDTPTKHDRTSLECDGDAGTSPFIEPRDKTCANNAHNRRSYKRNFYHSSTNYKEENVSNNASENVNDSGVSSHAGGDNYAFDFPRLIPEYVPLRDLKFRVQGGSDNLQMTLFNKFSVNVNTDFKAIRKPRSDALAWTTTQTKCRKMQSETTTSVKCEDVNKQLNAEPTNSSANSKDKCKYLALVNGQASNYPDDAKENLDPVMTITDNNLSDTPTVNSQNEQGNFTCGTFQTVEDTVNISYNQDKLTFDSNIANGTKTGQRFLQNNSAQTNFKEESKTEKTFDETESSTVTCVDDERLKNVIEKSNAQSLYSDYVSSSTVEKYSTEENKQNESCKSMKPVKRTLCSKYSSAQAKFKSKTGTCFRVSIDLNKIQNLIDINPDLFYKRKKDDDKRRRRKSQIRENVETQNLRNGKSMIDNCDYVSSLQFSSEERIAQLGNFTESAEKLPNLIQEASSINNSFSGGQQRSSKRTRHVDNQSPLDR